MTTLTLELPPELYERLHAEADRLGIPAPAIVQEWVAERLPTPSAMTDRERATEALRGAGLLAELSLEEQQRAARSTTTLEEVQAALGRADGKPLSELILEMRGSKE